MSYPVFTRHSYTVLWICTHPIEFSAARSVLQVVHNNLLVPEKDRGKFSLGSIGRHGIVIALLDGGDTAIRETEAVAIKAKHRFPRLQFCLLVGVGSGFQSRDRDLRLGDVIVGLRSIYRWDSGILDRSSFDLATAGERVSAPQPLSDAINRLNRRYHYDHRGNRIASAFRAAEDRPTYDPRRGTVHLPSYKGTSVAVHYGLVASGSTAVTGHRATRAIRKLLGGDVLCVDTQAAGAMNILPCLVIRGVCDYADEWQDRWWEEYAAATAAVYAKHLVEVLGDKD
ncbi:hypothetical protein ABW21_db0209414 [Orbilia brochopaga]|nr:hypothetical protein ABW21_db0209414 [Drechslerella brochopaga]